MLKRVTMFAVATAMSAVMFLCLGCELPKQGLGGYSSDEMIDELWNRGGENLGDLFDDLDGLFGDE